MIYFFITLPVIILAWIVYSSRDLFLAFGRWVLRRRYDVTLDGVGDCDPQQVYLVIPNHPAIVDPLIVVTELHKLHIDIQPLVDESFFSSRLVRHILALVNAVRVPDFRKSNFRPILKVRPSRRDSARKARALVYTMLATLTSGGNVLLYPSGHITANGRETIDNRQLAYGVVSQLPEDVRVLGVRTRGLYGSMWSRVGGRQAPPFLRTLVKAVFLWFVSPFRPKRKVSIHFEDITDKCIEWAAHGRRGFNELAEKWYDSDLALLGRDCEEAT